MTTGMIGSAAGRPKAADLRRVRPAHFSALRDAGPVWVRFGRDE